MRESVKNVAEFLICARRKSYACAFRPDSLFLQGQTVIKKDNIHTNIDEIRDKHWRCVIFGIIMTFYNPIVYHALSIIASVEFPGSVNVFGFIFGYRGSKRAETGFRLELVEVVYMC